VSIAAASAGSVANPVLAGTRARSRRALPRNHDLGRYSRKSNGAWPQAVTYAANTTAWQFPRLPGDPGVLAGDPRRGGPFLQLGGLVDRQDRSRVAQPRSNEPLQRGQRRRPVPADCSTWQSRADRQAAIFSRLNVDKTLTGLCLPDQRRA